MPPSEPPRPLWQPSPDAVHDTALAAFARWTGHDDSDYRALWSWSVDDLEGLWSAIWKYFDVGPDPGPVFGARREMPGTEWFPRAAVNYAELLFRDHDPAATAIRFTSEARAAGEWTWADLTRETARIRTGLVELGVTKGDRVAAYLPNIPETIAAFLACASLGAIWSSASPEFGAQAVIDRFAQIEPKVLLAVDGYVYGGRTFDRTRERDQIHAGTGGTLVPFGLLSGDGWPADFGNSPTPLEFASMRFADPLWILYSSGTTGLPKAIVHSHGGMLLEQLKHHHLHLDARRGDRVFWFTTTGWMMWNFLVGVLLTKASIVLFDGNPAGAVLWDLAETTGVTIFGTSAAFLTAAADSGIHPRQGRDLKIRAVGSTGSPLPASSYRWVYDELGAGTWLFSTSGGTDVCTAFVGGVPTLPVHEGELQAPALGARVEAWTADGEAVVGEVGELVLTAPLPSMPVAFWGDADGRRLRDAYFAMFPGIWRHGDWIELTRRGSAVIHGRSDATINRGGVRMGTSEIYNAVLALREVTDALVVDLPSDDGAASTMWLFVVLTEGSTLDDRLEQEIARAVRTRCSPRHVPDRVTAVLELPRTLSGKLVEVPVKRILLGAAPSDVVSRGSLANPDALDQFVELASAAAGTAPLGKAARIRSSR